MPKKDKLENTELNGKWWYPIDTAPRLYGIIKENRIPELTEKDNGHPLFFDKKNDLWYIIQKRHFYEIQPNKKLLLKQELGLVTRHKITTTFYTRTGRIGTSTSSIYKAHKTNANVEMVAVYGDIENKEFWYFNNVTDLNSDSLTKVEEAKT
jgi:uncharacterized protein YneR